jgi:hypothetical protein
MPILMMAGFAWALQNCRIGMDWELVAVLALTVPMQLEQK